MDEKLMMIKELCLKETSKDPIEIAVKMMKNEMIHMHGPEHHILDGSALLTAIYNVEPSFDLATALDELANRGLKMPGATCGQWGICGSASSIGAALAIIHETGPLSNNEYYKDNMRLTSQALSHIDEIGGPRCCKRNAFLSLQTAIAFVKDKYGIELASHQVECEFSHRNKQCIKERCPFHKK